MQIPRAETDLASTRFILRRVFAAGLCLSLAVVWGPDLVERFIAPTRVMLEFIDPRFVIQTLGISHNAQDTLVRLRVNLERPIVVGSIVSTPDPKGWLEVSTTVGSMLQPLLVGMILVLAWPASIRRTFWHGLTVAALGLLVIAIDLPLTLHAYVWDMFVQHYEPDRFSPLLIWFEFMHSGGRLAIGVLLAGLPALLPRTRSDCRNADKAEPESGRRGCRTNRRTTDHSQYLRSF